MAPYLDLILYSFMWNKDHAQYNMMVKKKILRLGFAEYLQAQNLLLFGITSFMEPESERILVVIDESERLFKGGAYQREHNPAVTAFLTHTGEDSRYFSIIATTNYIEDMDEAAESRLNPSIELGDPGPNERKKILAYYFKDYFAPDLVVHHFDDDILTELFNIAPHCLKVENTTEANTCKERLSKSETSMSDSIVALSEGLSGRDLKKVAEQTAAQAYFQIDTSDIDNDLELEHPIIKKKDLIETIVRRQEAKKYLDKKMEHGRKERERREDKKRARTGHWPMGATPAAGANTP